MQIKNKTVKNIIKGIENVKGENINIIDFTKLENVDFKYFVICDCQSNIQVNAISNSVKKTVSKELKEKPLNIEGLENKSPHVVIFDRHLNLSKNLKIMINKISRRKLYIVTSSNDKNKIKYFKRKI